MSFKIIAVRDDVPRRHLENGANVKFKALLMFALLATASAVPHKKRDPVDSLQMGLASCNGPSCLGGAGTYIQQGLSKKEYESVIDGNPIQVNLYNFPKAGLRSIMEPNCLALAIQYALRASNSRSSENEFLSTFINVQSYGQLSMVMAAYGFGPGFFTPSCDQKLDTYIEIMSDVPSPGEKGRNREKPGYFHVAMVKGNIREQGVQLDTGHMLHVVARRDENVSINAFSHLPVTERYIPMDFPYVGTKTMRNNALLRDIKTMTFSSYKECVQACKIIYFACQSTEHLHLEALQKRLVEYASTITVPDSKTPYTFEISDKLFMDLIVVDALLNLLKTEEDMLKNTPHTRSLKVVGKEIKKYTELFKKLVRYENHFMSGMSDSDSGSDARLFGLTRVNPIDAT